MDSNLRGSIWRKWDLQVQPIKNCWFTNLEQNIDSIQQATIQFVDYAIANGINVIAITDHNTGIAIDKAIDYSQSKEITILAGVELDANSGEHLIIIFNPEYKERVEKDTWKEAIESFLQTKCMIEPPFHTNVNSKKVSIPTEDLIKIVNSENIGILIFAHCTSNDGFFQRCGDANKRKEVVASFYKKDRAFVFEIKEPQREQEIRNKIQGWGIDDKCIPIISSSDANQASDVGRFSTWIKADPTFEGLKQILYEPEERVKIQETNPAFDFDKLPFTEIQIFENVDVFENEKDNVTFEKCILPLNNGLVSIIGGRGTGKSILIDYISAGLGQNIKKKDYTKSDKITIKRQTSLKDEPTSFIVSDNPNVQFMYISQSEIKSIVENTQEFTKNIRETIGVIDNYLVPREYKEKVDRYLNEYFGVIKILEADNTGSQQKKDGIDREIKRYNDFISNITSQENKSKLENYQKHLNALANRKAFFEKVQNQNSSILQFQRTTNDNISQINSTLVKVDEKLSIPLINVSTTTEHIEKTVLPKILELIKAVESEIQKTKDAFAGYSGDLATLLSDVAQYQKKVTELQGQKKIIEDNESIFETIKQNYFTELGAEIENSINAYKAEIESKWINFKNGSEDYTEEQKQLLTDILGDDNLNVEVIINFDRERMYQLLMQKLDGRSWNNEKLERTLNVDNLESYLKFINQTSQTHTFSSEINPIRSYVLDVLFRKYSEFITHNILVTSKNKNITKLSHGQQGTIYLRLKLAANLFSKTIIYDQPEDDLDNEFIMSDLVYIIRKIKKYRQIIIVSHNANLVVNADSEQVIIARNEEGLLKYNAGALENPEINKQICKILEGGERAFLDREKKYGFKTQKL